MTPSYQFIGFVAEYWDLLRSASTGWDDREFFHELIARHGQPVLDVGCGTGRLLLDFLQHGWDVDGIDVSPEMLDFCEAKADDLGLTVDVYQQPMETLDLPREYRTIIVASSAFQLIVDAVKATEAVRRFVEHLRPGGVLAIPITALWNQLDPPREEPEEWTSVTTVERPDGAMIRQSSRTWFDVAGKLEHRRDLYEVVVDGSVMAEEEHERSPSARGYSQEDAKALFVDAGFRHVQILDPITMKPVHDDQPLFVAVGQTA